MQDDILRNFRKIVTPQFVSDVAHQVKFNQRSTAQINGIDFVRMLLMQIGSGQDLNYSNLNARLSKINPRVHISNQALSEYFYQKSSVLLIKTIYEKVFSYQKDILLSLYRKNIDDKVLDLFNRIFIEDSTFCVLNKKLKSKYKGSGGSASDSSLKINLIHELKTGATVGLNISEGKIPDTSLSNLIMEELQTNDLVLRDLGYFVLAAMESISAHGAYFISRFRMKTNIYLNPEDNDPINPGTYFSKIYAKIPNQIVDVPIHLGETKQALRMIAYKVPQEIANERRRKAKKAATSKGRTPSEEVLNLCDYIILITNIPSEKIKPEVIGTIYRIRWSIELIFKTWKSQLNLQLSLKGSRATRIECFVHATLIVSLLTTLVYGWLKRKTDSMEQQISLDKLSKWLINKCGYYRLLYGEVPKLEAEIMRDLREIKIQKRKRKTTLQRVVSSEAYSEKYVVNF